MIVKGRIGCLSIHMLVRPSRFFSQRAFKVKILNLCLVAWGWTPEGDEGRIDPTQSFKFAAKNWSKWPKGFSSFHPNWTFPSFLSFQLCSNRQSFSGLIWARRLFGSLHPLPLSGSNKPSKPKCPKKTFLKFRFGEVTIGVYWLF